MNSKNTVKNAYKGLLLNFFIDLRSTAIVGGIIVISISVFDIIMTIIFLNLDEHISNDGTGTIFTGAIVMFVALLIHVIGSTSQNDMHSKFAFPINRTIYAVSNFLFILFGSFILLAIVTILAPVEMFLYGFLELVTHKIIYLNQITFHSFLVGFAATWAYLLAFGSLTYGIFMYIRRYKLYTLPVIAIVITSVFAFGWFGDIIRFFFLEDSLLLLIVKLLVITIISHILGFIPLKRMEVQ